MSSRELGKLYTFPASLLPTERALNAELAVALDVLICCGGIRAAAGP